MAKEKELIVKQKAEKIDEKHLKQLQSLINTINSIQFNIGKMEMQKMHALEDVRQTKEKISQMQDTLTREYGTYDVNINDGTINWPESKTEDEVEKSKENEK
tara:strand:- start:238 stop:543 length:306 start_codon:yes stop_codon:yes gene_type:complete